MPVLPLLSLISRSSPKQFDRVFPELRPRSVSGGDLDLAQAHHGPLADVDPRRGGQEGRKGAGTDGKGERAGDTAQLDLGLLRPRVCTRSSRRPCQGSQGTARPSSSQYRRAAQSGVGVGPGQAQTRCRAARTMSAGVGEAMSLPWRSSLSGAGNSSRHGASSVPAGQGRSSSTKPGCLFAGSSAEPSQAKGTTELMRKGWR